MLQRDYANGFFLPGYLLPDHIWFSGSKRQKKVKKKPPCGGFF